MKSYLKTMAPCLVALLGVAGCARYQAKTLHRLIPQSAMQSNAHSLSFAYHVFTPQDCKKYLDRNVIAKGYQPVQIAFMNNSNRHIKLSPQAFSFVCAQAYEVAQNVHTSTVKRAVGYGVAGLFVWPLLIPAVVDGFGSKKANEKLDYDYNKKILHDCIVSPYSMVNGLIFVPTDEFETPFTLRVTDINTDENFILHSNSASLIFEK